MKECEHQLHYVQRQYCSKCKKPIPMYIYGRGIQVLIKKWYQFWK